MMKLSTDEQIAMYRKLAKEQYSSIEIEIDEYPDVSVADDGAWVAAWVWVGRPDDEDDDDEDPSP